MLILSKSSPKKCRLLGHRYNFQKNIGPAEDSMDVAQNIYVPKIPLIRFILFDWIIKQLVKKHKENEVKSH